MATYAFATGPCRRLSLEVIDAVVSARLGVTRIRGNEQPACFNRQVAMYLARHIGRWSTTLIGRFYNGRDHSTVCHGIQRIESLRESDPEVDALIAELKEQLENESFEHTQRTVTSTELPSISELSVDELVDLVTARVCAWIEERMRSSERLSGRILTGD
jgi:Bacterial dnaA protein helix-turn-helix